nr:MAG TPA: hypothetical protein [Caudoviricetes sp.]
MYLVKGFAFWFLVYSFPLLYLYYNTWCHVIQLT